MRKTVIAIILALAATAILAAAAARQDSKPAPPMMPGMMREMMMTNMMPGSPMNLPGVEIAVSDTPDGVTVSFTTKTGDVAELRRLVRQRVEMMQRMHAWRNTEKPDSK